MAITPAETSVEEVIKAREAALYEDWKRSGPHLEEYASEFAGTAFLLFCVVGAVAFTFSPGAALTHLLPSSALRLLLVGLALGGASWAVAVSPPGRLSGAHLNPAMSAGFWLLGKMHGRDVFGYVSSQMAGGILGTLLGRAVFGAPALAVRLGSLHPGPDVSFAETIGGELAATFALALAVYTFVGYPKLMRWTPAMATVLVGLLVCIDGNYSGAGMNPARWFGPALVAHVWLFAGAYAFAPILAAFAASGLRRLIAQGRPAAHTAKLFHDPRYRSIFRNDGALSQPPERVRAEARS